MKPTYGGAVVVVAGDLAPVIDGYGDGGPARSRRGIAQGGPGAVAVEEA